MDLGLQGKSAFVCGASQGLGLAIAEALAEEGARVGLFARNGAKLVERAKALQARGHKAMALAGDMGDFATVEKALALRRGAVGLPACAAGSRAQSELHFRSRRFGEQPGEIGAIGDVDDERIERRSPLRLEDARNGEWICCVAAETVHRLSGKCHQLACSQRFGSPLDICCRGR